MYTHISKYILLLFGCLVVSDSLQSHGLQHTRLPCSSPSPGALLKLMSIESVMPSNHLILCRPHFLLPSIFPSIRVFSNESTLRIRRPKHWSYSFSNSPSKENSGLIFFRMDWLDLLAVQGTLKSLLQHHGFKSIISEWWGLEKDISTGHSFQRILQDHVPYTWPTPKGL